MSLTWREFSDEISITPSVVMATAKWCGPCKKIKPLVYDLKKENPNINFMVIDIDECQEIADKLKIGSIPDFRFYRNGVAIFSFTGADQEKLRLGIDKLCGKN